MRKRLHSLLLLLVACCLLGGVPAALASHIQGGQMTYRYISGDTYEVTVSFYRDCTGIALPTGAITINARQACNSTAVTGSLSPVPGSLTTGTGYCPAIQALATCTSGQTTYPNYQKQDYRGTIILPPAATWIISYDDSARPSTANLVGQPAFRFEATLNNLVTVNGVPTRVNNTSPLFSARDIPVPFVIVNQQTSINFTSALEPDGDSLVYSLDQPLASCGVFNNYAVRPAGSASGCVTQVLPGTASGTSCIINCGTIGGANFTADLPITVANDTVGLPACYTPNQGILTRTVTPRFRLDRSNGQITFTPNLFRPGSAALGLNKYVIVGKITEYRRLPGSNRRYLVGSVRRDFLVIVIDGSGNTLPTTPVVTIPDPKTGGTTINTADTTRITVKTCNYTQVRVNFTDPDNITTPTHPAVSPLQNLTVTYTGNGTINFNQLQNGDIGTFQLLADGTPNPQGIFYFQPGSSYAGQTIRIPLRIEDNACPVKGIQTRIIEIKIVPGPFAIAAGITGANGIGNTTPIGTRTICPGGALTLRGKVVRPDSIRRLATSTTQLQVYAYQWSVVSPGGNGLPAVTTDSVITVNPTRTTRYRLNISPTLGFAQGTCNDTTSILVRVADEPVATATASLGQVCAGGAVLLTGRAARPNTDPATPVLNDTYSYTWTGPGLPAAGRAGATLTVNPTTLGVNTYTLRADGLAPYGCDATTTVSVTVVPPPTVTATPALPKVCAGAPVLLTANAVRPAGAGSTLADTYTYTWTGPGVAAGASGKTFTVRPTTLGVNTYTVTATGLAQFNCASTATVTVEVVAPPTVAVTTSNAFLCPGGTNAATLTAVATPAPNFSDSYTYVWSTGGATGPVVGSGATLSVRPTATTTYTVTATGAAQTGCAVTGTVTVNVTPALAARFEYVDSVGANGQRTNRPPVTFTFRNSTVTAATGQAPTATFTYKWTYQRVRDIAGMGVSEAETTFATTTAVPATPLPSPAPLTLNNSGYYIIRLTANANVGGASCTTNVFQRTILVPDIQVPNIITPNGDGLNDVFKISTAGTSSKMEVYNRWGRKVYEQANYQNNWGGDNQPAGVYYYLVTTAGGAQTKGWLEIVR